MIERVEVTAGAGTVIRYGGIVAWADPSASAALISFLAQSARNLSPSPWGGRQIADHIAGVLATRDPEAHVAFAVVGPSDHGWASLLHGPVQAWDGARWLAPTPSPGWLQAIITPRPAITVSAAGTPTPAPQPDAMWDLEAGVVPGAGFVLVPSGVPGRFAVVRPPMEDHLQYARDVEAPAAAPAPGSEVSGESQASAPAQAAMTTALPAVDQTAVLSSLDLSEAAGAQRDAGFGPQPEQPAAHAGTELAAAAGLAAAAAAERAHRDVGRDPTLGRNGEAGPETTGRAEEAAAAAAAAAAGATAEPVATAQPVATAEPVAATAEPAAATAEPAAATAEPAAATAEPAAATAEPAAATAEPAAATAEPAAATAEPAAATAEPAVTAEPEPNQEPPAPTPPGQPVVPGPAGSLDLRHVAAAASSPLPRGGGPDQRTPGAPVVAGALCARGHLNRPGLTACARCRTPIPEGVRDQVSGTRPPLGVLVSDDGTIYRLDRAYLIGSASSRDPTVGGGLARPLTLSGNDVSGSHAELRLADWDVLLVDRGSAAGTCVFEPGAAEWARLNPFEPHVLQPGTHVAFGQRVMTFLSPWVVPT